mgnify:CR=1 FL=1
MRTRPRREITTRRLADPFVNVHDALENPMLMPVGEKVVELILDLVRACRPGEGGSAVNAAVAWGPGPRAAQAYAHGVLQWVMPEAQAADFLAASG